MYVMFYASLTRTVSSSLFIKSGLVVEVSQIILTSRLILVLVRYCRGSRGGGDEGFDCGPTAHAAGACVLLDGDCISNSSGTSTTATYLIAGRWETLKGSHGRHCSTPRTTSLSCMSSTSLTSLGATMPKLCCPSLIWTSRFEISLAILMCVEKGVALLSLMSKLRLRRIVFQGSI